jgi:hypothetical protein
MFDLTAVIKIVVLTLTLIDESQATTTASSDPVIINWTKCTGKNGYGGQLSDVQKVEYSDSYVYITSTSVPGTYTAGTNGWADDPYTVNL